jgi:hypothetical protein
VNYTDEGIKNQRSLAGFHARRQTLQAAGMILILFASLTAWDYVHAHPFSP